MKIGIISLSYLPVSEESMGGLEVFVNNLARALIRQGHSVTVFGLKESKIEGAEIVGLYSASEIREDGLPLDNKFFVRRYVTFQSIALLEALGRQDEFDVLHVNLAEWQLGFLLGAKAKNLVVTTHGNYMTPRLTKDLLHNYGGPKMANVSKYVFDSMFPSYEKKFVVHNGIDISRLHFDSVGGDYLVWLGRISAGKAPHLAIEVVKKTGLKLIIAGGIDYQDYFDSEIKPHLGDNITYVGPVFGTEKAKLLAGAKVSLFTSQLEESFGFVAAESMACGTPVIAFNKGALGEVVTNGETGFIVDNVDEMAEKVGQIDSVSREQCRLRVEENFTVEKMAEKYITLYKS